MLERSSASPKESSGSGFEGPPTSTGLGVIGESDDSNPGRLGGLVLTRRMAQSIVIGGEVELQVVDLKVNAVRLKITAPRSIPIHRREVFESIKSGGRPGASKAQDGPTPRPGQGSLVLTRHVGESVMIGDAVEVEVAGIRSSAVRLRINAPREIAVHRREIHDAIRRSEPGGVSEP
jgi:carbon storage regulator